nr:hypothetical protein [Tanacetum cinerariifolium]GEY40242.1 hypothetical protein [Tanacetum cinerariifolium]
VLSYDESKSRRVSERAFMTLFGEDNETFTSTMFLYLEMLFAEYTGIKVKQFRETLLLHMGNVKKSVAERTRHKDNWIGTKLNEHITSSSSGTYITHVVDADIRPVNDQEPSTEVYLTAQYNVLANKQQHTDQSEPSYDTYLLEKVYSNTTPDSTKMCHRGGEIDQDAEQDQVKSSLLKDEFLKTNDMVEKEVYNKLSNRFLQLEKHCISLEISIQQKEESFQSNKPSGVNNISSKPITPHYFPKVRESVFVKPNHVIASGSSRNSTKASYGSNDMAHNYYLKEAKKKTQNKIMNLKPSVMHTTSLQDTTNGRKPKPRSNNQTSRSLPVPKSSREMLNGLALHRQMAFADNTSGPDPQRKERFSAAVAAPRAIDPAGSTSSTTIDQDVP